MGSKILSNDAALRQFYDAYLVSVAPSLIDRLRRYHLEDFRAERDLDMYVERKSLTFLPFNNAWVLQYETLDTTTQTANASWKPLKNRDT